MRMLLAILLLAVTPARAEPPWTVLDLGHLKTEAHCLEAAVASFERARALFGLDRMRRGRWVVYADGLQDPGRDAVITCTFGERRGARATLVIHSPTGPGRTTLIARTIARDFEERRRRIRARWLEKLEDGWGG